MALPTRVHRGQTYDPFEGAQREFDTMLNRFFGGREVAAANGTGGYLAPYGVDVREDGDHLRRSRTAGIQERRGRHHAGEPDANDRRRAPARSEERRREKRRPAPARAAVHPLPPQLHASADRRRADRRREACGRRADDHAEQARRNEAAEDHGRLSRARRALNHPPTADCLPGRGAPARSGAPLVPRSAREQSARCFACPRSVL